MSGIINFNVPGNDEKRVLRAKRRAVERVYFMHGSQSGGIYISVRFSSRARKPVFQPRFLAFAGVFRKSASAEREVARGVNTQTRSSRAGQTRPKNLATERFEK